MCYLLAIMPSLATDSENRLTVLELQVLYTNFFFKFTPLNSQTDVSQTDAQTT